MAMQTWKVELTISVDDSWVADGFDLVKRWSDPQELAESLIGGHLLPGAYGHEYKAKAKFLQAPDPSKVRELQGY